MVSMLTRRILWVVILFCLTAVLAGPCLAQGLGEEEDDDVEDIELDEPPEPDYELLRASHLSDVSLWPGVLPLDARRIKDRENYAWKSVAVEHFRRFAPVKGRAPYPPRPFARPVSDKPISTRIAVPEKGEYRVWLGYVGGTKEPRPVTLRLGGANDKEHVFGAVSLPVRNGRQLEKEFPVRFESDMARELMGVGGTETVIWEYWDVELADGDTVLGLSTENKKVRIDAVFLTLSKAFVPNKSLFMPDEPERDTNLVRSYQRYRVAEAEGKPRRVNITSFLHYCSAHYRRGSDTRYWYSSVMPSSTSPIPDVNGRPGLTVGPWSKWIDVTGKVTSGGTYVRNRLTVTGMKTGVIELQSGWFPHEAAALRTIRLPVAEGRTLCMMPVNRYGYILPPAGGEDGKAVWGMRADEYVGRLENEGDILGRILALMENDEIKEADPPLKLIKLHTSFGVSPSAADMAIPPLKRVGINWLNRLPLAMRRKYGLTERRALYNQGAIVNARIHCPLDPEFEDHITQWAEKTAARLEKDDPDVRTRPNHLKMGDEIGPVVGEASIARLPDCRRAFHEYLREQLRAEGKDASFFGVDDVEKLEFSLERPPDMGRFQRRVYYHSARFNWILTSRYYERFTAAARKVFPNLLTSCNYTPGSFMFGGNMTSSNWFALARYGGSNMAYGEGWVRPRGRYAFTGTQSIGYYAAIEECAARKHDLPMWFILVCGTGESDRKMLGLVSRDIYIIDLYSWGPAYAGVDAFSGKGWTYPQINRGVRALAPAEEIIVKGKRDPRRVALVYNRTDEYWRPAFGGLYVDRLTTFMALQHGHVPTDVILDTDITPEQLEPYRIVYLNGMNVTRRSIPVLIDWVRSGGILYGISGTAMRDEYDDPIAETEELFGAKQRVAGVSKSTWYYSQWWPIGLRLHVPIDKIRIAASELTNELTADVVGVKAVLTPTTGKSIATFSDGSCGGVLHELGKGKTLLLGVMPGHLYGHTKPIKWEAPYDDDLDGRPLGYKAERRELITGAALRAAGRPRAEHSEPLVEVTLFEHESGIAVLLTDYSYRPDREAVLTVKTDRAIKEVTSAMRGALKWERRGDRIMIEVPVPDPVDTVILR